MRISLHYPYFSHFAADQRKPFYGPITETCLGTTKLSNFCLDIPFL